MSKSKKKFYVMRCNKCGLKVHYSGFMAWFTQKCPKDDCDGTMIKTGDIAWLSDEDDKGNKD